MGFFSSIIGGGLKLLSGGKQRKENKRARASAEKLAAINSENLKMQMQSDERQRAHELSLGKNNKQSFIPWVIGGAVGLVSILGVVLATKKRSYGK
jgi:hypothetical protein